MHATPHLVAAYSTDAPQLKFLAMRLLSQPASASSSEQSWSEDDFVHSKKRNRLKTDVARKLVYVHSNMRLLAQNEARARHDELMKQSVLADPCKLFSRGAIAPRGWTA